MTVKRSIGAATRMFIKDAARLGDALDEVRDTVEIATYKAVDTDTLIAMDDINSDQDAVSLIDLAAAGFTDATRAAFVAASLTNATSAAVDTVTWPAFDAAVRPR